MFNQDDEVDTFVENEHSSKAQIASEETYEKKR